MISIKAQPYCPPLLGNPISAVITVEGTARKHNQIYGVYTVFGYIIPAVFLTLFMYQYVMHNPDHKLTLAILLVILFFIQLYLAIQV